MSLVKAAKRHLKSDILDAAPVIGALAAASRAKTLAQAGKRALMGGSAGSLTAATARTVDHIIHRGKE